MESNGVSGVAQRKSCDSVDSDVSSADNLSEVAGLDIQDGPPKPGPFAAYEMEPPPPPKLSNRGIVTMDITEQFTNAAQSRYSLDMSCLSRADLSATRAGDGRAC